MHTSNRSACHPCSNRVSATSRTAVYGPVRTVVWEGRSRELPPIPIFGTSRHFAAAQQFDRIWSEADINHRAGLRTSITEPDCGHQSQSRIYEYTPLITRAYLLDAAAHFRKIQ